MTENSTVRGLRQLSEQAKKLHINLNGLVDREESTPPIVGSKVLIYKGKLHPEYMRVAVKSIRFVLRGERKAVKRVLRDIKLWTRLQHENVVQVFGIATEFDFAVSIVCQWMELGNAHDYVQDKAIDPRSLLMGIARGLDYLHNHKLGPIFHGELKGRHVHIAEDGRPVLTDIGLSSFVESSFVMMATSSAAWSTRWMAPEILEEFKGASAEGDVWAFGMTALELFTRNPPFIDITNTYGVITRIIRGRPPERPSPETTCYRLTEEWWRICGMCWRHRPSSRPRISRIVEAIENLMHPTGQTTQMLTSPSAVAPTGLGSTTRVYTTIIGVKLFDILAMLRRHLPSVPSISGIYESPRQFIFLPPDGTPGVATDLDHMQITLTLTPKNIHGKQCTPVAWQVFNLNSDKEGFLTTLPQDVGIGLATTMDGSSAVQKIHVRDFNHAPPGHAIIMKRDDGHVVLGRAKKYSLAPSRQILVKNESGSEQRLAIGSYHMGHQKGELQFRAFLVAPIPNATSFFCERALVLNAYLTQTLQAGQVMTPEILAASDPLFAPSDPHVRKLKGVSAWRLVSVGQGKMQLVAAPASKSKTV